MRLAANADDGQQFPFKDAQEEISVAQNFRVYCKRGVHPYDPVVSARNAADAKNQVGRKFSEMYGRGIHGTAGCRGSGEECDLIAIPTRKPPTESGKAVNSAKNHRKRRS